MGTVFDWSFDQVAVKAELEHDTDAVDLVTQRDRTKPLRQSGPETIEVFGSEVVEALVFSERSDNAVTRLLIVEK
ncbi:MAG TPA: hypothetical protein VJL29_05210 [Thermoguttaceae bacterium]|nr:hypothetical protein [Thermoguttaceae bacterium]